ncbi:type IV-A pilus assembly ATPase PilB [Candidatus Magnetominusculus xianensis]|uniref:Type II secretion system protein GspE n=1 Tax=Candidatus Magnetominusculus xianensis TaxID=1748249 RepID=A0ABR5SDI1_9BACT|nr:type IV-A pilus assembly ATPase PilB [Candidatus Magnetominusculus xianensis]KWT83000.1 type II secretion system protein GspE [Candidatus Magnetominusculus xianensis]MBF0402710.1 type IV-A pilus assembly ATPase PilB [Nitrospirota bacterium]
MAALTLLGQQLVKATLVTEKQVEEGLAVQKTDNVRLGTALVKLGYIKEPVLMEFLSKQYNVPLIDLSKYQVDTTLMKIYPYEKAKKNMMIPVSKDGSSLKVAIADPSNRPAVEEIQFITKMKITLYVTTEASILKAIDEFYPKGDKQKVALDGVSPASKVSLGMDEINKLIGKAQKNVTIVEDKEERVSLKDAEAAPIITLVNGILINAVGDKASDIHIEPTEKEVILRYRMDGVLKQIMPLPGSIKNALTSRIKIMARLDIAERRIPQDGRIKLKYDAGGEIDFRVSTLPTLFGEKIVMRLLDKSNLQLDLTKLGFLQGQLDDFVEALNKPYGMLLVTGPTGSGKTTTLYSGLQAVNKPDVNIMTAEDPVEFNLAGINQVQIKQEVGLTFATALRAFLRQDPDIIMVGEIRDHETAEIAVKAALTGHMVLSTLHTNDAPSTITRLMNMGIEPFLVSSSVILVLAQRLARKICEKCKAEIKVSEKILTQVGVFQEDLPNFKTHSGAGCDACNQTGYKGRIALYEVMPVKNELKELILSGATVVELKNEAVRLGMLTLRQSGLVKVNEGVTTVDEVLRCTFGD